MAHTNKGSTLMAYKAHIENGSVVKVFVVVNETEWVTPAGKTEVDADESWSKGGTYADGVYIAPAKIKTRIGEFRDFLNAFTTQEQVSIKTAAMDPANVALALWYDKAMGGATFSLDHPDTDAGLTALVAAGLLTADRKVEILASDFDTL